MHCRKVRSYLSAYSNDELTGAVLREVRGHLANCRECRSEEAVYRSVRLAARQLPGRHIGADFNARILDRIAKERFAETRTRAYLPKPAPSMVWRRVVPVVSSVFVVALLAVGVAKFSGGSTPNTSGAGQIVDIGKNDDYLTAQPANLNREWSLNNHMAQSDRMSALTTSMTQTAGFEPSGSLAGVQSGQSGIWFRDSRHPYTIYFYRVRPVIRFENQSVTNASYKESDKVY
jgi:hypothetical protein